MSAINKMKLEAGVALVSVGIGVAGAILIEPIIIGVAAAGAFAATAMRLADKQKGDTPQSPIGRERRQRIPA